MNRTFEFRGGRTYYDEIAFLRGFSILTIVLMHLIQGYLKSCPGFLWKASSLGGTGVHVFFFCSGFGLYLSYMRNPVGYLEFLRRRFLKIYIPYVIIIGISALVPVMYGGNRIKALFSHIFLYKMFIPEYECSFGEQFWFISTLFQLYLLFLPLCRWKEKLGGRVFFLVSFLLSGCWWGFISVTGLYAKRIWNSFFLQFLWEFGLGMCLAKQAEQGCCIRLNAFSMAALSAVGLGVTAATALRGGPIKNFNDVFGLMGYGFFALLLYCCGGRRVKGWILALLEAAYELYLVHVLVFSVIFSVGGGWDKFEYGAGCISLTAAWAVSFLYHRCLERCRKIWIKGERR